MSGIGSKHPVWTKEKDDKLLSEIASGKTVHQIIASMNMGSQASIYKRIHQMGFDGLVDARKVLTD